jgi:2-C-methyl-D-erythritol 2,4-cyclodiphosphate synthase
LSQKLLRIGNGFDSHRFESKRKLILGGIQIPYLQGLAGHSDADVLTHAVIDALLGAANLGDIGEHFPPSDPAYKDVSSILLLKKVCALLQAEHWQVVNLDCILICEAPKISPYKKEIIESLALVLNVNPSQIGLKGKTAESMGALGRGEGMAAMVIALLEKPVSG